jgi:hypothetical protein
VRLLPPPVQSIGIPTELSVTALTETRPCLLAPVAYEDPSVPLLHLGPQAELGSILHKLVEDAGRGKILSSGDTLTAVRSHFDMLLRKREEELRRDAFSRIYADLERSFSFLDWHSRTEIAISEAVRLFNHRPLVPVSEFENRLNSRSTDLNVYLSRAGEFRLFEVPFHSPGLRLKGRIDEVVKRASGTIEVTDYKTGRIMDNDGNLSERIVLQLRLYGLVILESVPSASVQPYVQSGEQRYVVPFTPYDVQQTESEHKKLLGNLPPEQSRPADSLAELGPHCRTCRVRHVCPRYRTEVTTLWAKPIAQFRLPLDVSGSVVGRERVDNGAYTLTLRDAVGRLVKIHRLNLSEEDFEALTVFRQVWFFNLSSHEGGLRSSIWHHPRNFYQLPANPGEARAWSMEIFAVDGDC